MSRQSLDLTDDVLMAFFLIDVICFCFEICDLMCCFPSYEIDKFRPQPA